MKPRSTKSGFTGSSLPQDIKQRLSALNTDIASADVLILPTQTRDDITHYIADDVTALKIARASGLNAAYLVPSEDRTYIEEYSAEWALDLALAILQTISADMATGLSKYLWQRARAAVSSGIHPGPTDAVPIRLKIVKFKRNVDGAVSFDDLDFEGDPNSLEEVLKSLVTPHDGPTREEISDRPEMNSIEGRDNDEVEG